MLSLNKTISLEKQKFAKAGTGKMAYCLYYMNTEQILRLGELSIHQFLPSEMEKHHENTSDFERISFC